MKRRLFSIQNLISLNILIPFVLFIAAEYFKQPYAYYDYGLFAALVLVMIFALRFGTIPGLLLSGSIIFAYGSVIFYQLFMGYAQVWTLNYQWFVFYPITALINGNIHQILEDYNEKMGDCQEISHKIVNIDPHTGFGNSREMLRDLDREMSRAKRYHQPLSLVVIQIQYFEELKAIYGDQDESKIFQILSEIIDKAVRVEDLRFRLEDDLFALILPHTTAEAAIFVKTRIKEGLTELTIDDQSSLNRYKLEVKIGISAYNKDIPNPMAYKALALKELEYDV